MPPIIETNVAEPFLELLEFAGRSGQRFTRAINSGALFHDFLHRLAEVSDWFAAAALLKKLFLQPRLLVQRLGQQVTRRRFLFRRIGRRRPPGSGAKYQKLWERIRT